MKKKGHIERKVMEHYQVSKDDLYDTSKRVYPFSAARSVLMYFLYISKEYRMRDIQRLFGYDSQRTVEMRVATVASSVKKGTDKLAEDVMIIKEKLNEKTK